MLEPVVFGLNYQTADIELRNQLAFATDEIPEVLMRLINSGVVKEALLLSTCNRTELYCITNDVNFVINSLCFVQDVCPRKLMDHSYTYYGIDCARHLFRVISGLESMVLGESEIVAQIKSAMTIAKQQHGLGSSLSALFQMALELEKEVRSNTAINNVAISMGHAVVNYVMQYLNQLPNRNALFIGAGQMMQQIAPHFNYLPLDKKLVINRTLSRAEVIANKINANVEDLLNLNEVVDDFAIILICCASNAPLIDELTLAQDIIGQRPKLIIDLSMPLVITQQLKTYTNLNIITIDDIASLVDVGLEKRKIAAIEAEGIIATKLNDYYLWQHKREITPLICKLREQAEMIRLDSLRLAQKQLMSGKSANEVLAQFSLQLTNRLLHTPTTNLVASNGQWQEELGELLGYLYNLDTRM